VQSGEATVDELRAMEDRMEAHHGRKT